jgi:4'-phosphopantetheinyl transferase EntD
MLFAMSVSVVRSVATSKAALGGVEFVGLFDPGVICLAGHPEQLGPLAILFQEEERAIEQALTRRRIQYSATRFLARQVFTRLGLGQHPLLNAEDRRPLWPAGVVGSLTHSDDWCAVAVAESDAYLALGIDAERAERLAPALYDRVLTAPERAVVAALPQHEQQRVATLFFSAKESVYKCQYPLTRTFLGFQDVELTFDFAAMTFQVRFVQEHPALPAAAHFCGRFIFQEGQVLTSVSCLRACPGNSAGAQS